MADKYTTPAYGIPGRFKTPEQEHQERVKALEGNQIEKAFDSWIPGVDFINTLARSTGSSFFSGLAGDAKTLDYIFDSDITKSAEHSLRNVSDTINKYKPSRAITAAEKTFVHDDGTLGDAWGDIFAYADLAGSGLGSIGAMILGGGALKMVGKGSIKAYAHQAIKKKTDDLLKTNKNLSREAAEKQVRGKMTDYAEKYDSALGTVAYGTAEAAIVSGSVGQSIEQEVMRAPPEVLNQSPRFREMYYDLLDNNDLTHDAAHNAARVALSREAGIQGAKEVAIPSLLLGSVAGRYIDKAINGRLTKSTLANFGILEAIEMPTEAAQGGTEQYIQNKVYQELIDKQRGVWEGVPDAAIREGLGVAFGVAPLALVSAKAEADRAAGIPPSTERLTDNEELTLIDMAAKINEAATEEVIARTANDPQARYDGLAEIIALGNRGKPKAPAPEESIDLDLELDEDAVAEMEDEAAANDLTGDLIDQGMFGEDEDDAPPPPGGSGGVVAPEPETPADVPVEGDISPEPPKTPPAEPITDDIDTEPEPEAPITEDPEEEPAPEPAPEGGLPAHKVDFEAFRTGKQTGTYTPEPASTNAAATSFAVGTQQDSVDLDAPGTLDRIEANELGKALGIKTITSRSNLNDRLVQVAHFTNDPTPLSLGSINNYLKNPYRLDSMKPDEIQDAATNLAEKMGEAANEIYDRQQHREAIETAIEAGDFTLEDFEALPESDQKAYADIGKQLRADATPETKPEGDVETPRTGKPETPEVPEGDKPVGGEGAVDKPDEGTGEEETPEGEPEIEKPGEVEVPSPEPEVEKTPEETPEEIAAREEKEAADEAEATANREAIQLALDELEPEMKATVYGVTLSGGKPMKPEVYEFMSSGDGIYHFKRGKQRRNIKLIDGDFYLMSLSNKRGRRITEIERKKVLKKDEGGGNIGGTIRRPHEIWKDHKTFDDAEKELKHISSLVSHANYIKSVNYGGKTHGVKRMYADLLGNVPPFLKWIAPYIGSEHGGATPKEAVLAILRNQPLTQYGEGKRVNIQTPEELNEVVEKYINMMTAIQQLVIDAADIKQLRNNYARSEFEQELGEGADNKIDSIIAMDDGDYELKYQTYARSGYRDRKELKAGIVPELKKEDSIGKNYPELFSNITYHTLHGIYKGQTENENTSDEKLKPVVPRQRESLTVLAARRNGMPDHRNGKNVTGEELVEKFGFTGLTYGQWVSDVALEGEISEQQQYRNLVYDSFADLAYLTGLPLKVMGKDLYLSLGAVGHGKSTGLAFFSPAYQKIDVTDDETENNIRDLRTILDNNDTDYSMEDSAKVLLKKVEKVMQSGDAKVDLIRIIQFTREKGDGAFAHEWAHNLGNKLKRLEDRMAEPLQERPNIFALHRSIKRAIRDYIKSKSDYYDEEELLQNLRDSIEGSVTWSKDYVKPTSYMKNSKFMDVKAAKPGRLYWSTTHEMYARAVEAYIHDAMAAEGDGASNPFLQSPQAADGAVSTATGYLASIYPEGEERQYFNDLLKQMFSDIKATDEGDVAFDQEGEEYELKFGIQAQFEKIKKDYLDNLDKLVEQAREDRLEALLAEDEYEEENDFEGWTDEEIEDFVNPKGEDAPEPKIRKPKEGGATGGTRTPRGPQGGDAPGLGTKPGKGKSVDDIISDLDRGGFKLSDKDKGILDDLLKGDTSDDTRFSMSIDDFSDTRFSIETVGDRNPDLDPETYGKIAGFLSRMLAQFKDAGNRNIADFGREMRDKAGPFISQYEPYFLQFFKDIRDGSINYRDYVDSGDQGVEQEGEGTADGGSGAGEDDGTGVQQPADEQAGERDGEGATTTGDTGASPTGEGADGRPDLDNAGDNALAGLSPEELSERIQKETGLRSPSVEPLPSNLGVSKAQVPKKAIANVRDYETPYQVPTSMSENMENSVLRLSDIVGDLDEYVMKALEYDNQEQFDNGYMSLQVEAIAAAIYQMQERHRSVIIADQTGVGKGRQAGGLIRWAIKQGKTPIFVTENDGLYTDMYYDMIDSGTDFINPFITNTGKGIKNRDVDEDAIAQAEHDGKAPPLLHKLKDTITTDHIKAMAKDGTMPAGKNVIFTTYAQMNQAGTRREALLKLADSKDVVLILDESHKAAKFDPKKGRINRNEYFTDLIKRSWGTTYLSATFAKNPQNLAFYFNTDLSDAMDGMKQLVDVLSSGGIQLQEVMSRALTRNGQLFRREISYEGIDIATEFDDKNIERDKGYIDKLSEVIQDLIPVNNKIYNQLAKQYNKDPMGVANLLYQRREITDTEYASIQDAVTNNKQIKINFTRVVDQMHNLTDQILVASKADLAVDKILEDIKLDQKPIIGLDKTNMAMLHEYITRTDKVVGDDMSDLNWSGLLEFWGNKSFNVSIGVGPNPKESERIRGNLGRSIEGVDEDLIAGLDAVNAKAKALLTDIDLPLSPIDYITQTAERRAQQELGKNISIREITGRYSGDYGIDYSGETPVLYKVAKFEKRSVIDAFNGEVKDAKNNKLPSTVDGMVINQSGSTGVSLHSSEKHGDRKIRHMTIIEPAGDINVFQQMLGRIFRTGMGETYPLYTVLASAIPSDARKINVLRKKMESLNAQTSSNREGAAGVTVEDIINIYGDDAVEAWVQTNIEFQELFPQWEGKKQHERGLAYWVTGKITLFPFEYQRSFYEEVMTLFNDAVEQAKADGSYTLEEKFYDWEAEYQEEITIAEPRKDGSGFNSGSWLVKLKAKSNFRAMKPDEVASAIEEGKKADLLPDQDKVRKIFDFHMQLKDEKLAELEALALDKTDDDYMNRVFTRYKQTLKGMYDASLNALLGDANHAEKPYAINQGRVDSGREYLEQWRESIRNLLPKGGKLKYDELESSINRAIREALDKANQEKWMKAMVIGKTYQLTVGVGDNAFSTIGTVIALERLNKSVSPYTMGDVQVKIAVNKPGGSDDNGVMVRTLNQVSAWGINPVSEWSYGTPDQNQVLTKYHETLAETSTTTEEWVILGNPLIGASEIVPETAQYMQFSDKYGRRMFGIKMPKKAIENGVQGMIKGNLEIPSDEGGKIITDYIRENPHSRLSREFGFRTRGQNVIVTLDQEATESIRVKFLAETAAEKANDPTLIGMLDAIGVQMHRFGESGEGADKTAGTIEFTVGFADAKPIINQLIRRSRLVVQESMKYQLKNYMNIGQSVKAGENIVSNVSPKDVEKYVFESGGDTITAHRGEYQTNAGVTMDGFYMEGLGRFFDLKRIARLTLMKGRAGSVHEGRPFLKIDEFTRGNVQNGHDGKQGLGKPVLGESVKKDGTSFRLGLGEKPRVTVEGAEAALDSLPNRLSRLVKVVNSEDELPLKVRLKINTRKINGQVKGVFHQGKIYIVASKLTSPQQAMIVFLHEAVGHLGVRKLMGEDLKALLDQVGDLYPDQMRELASKYKVDIKTDAGWYEIAEEVLAHAAEEGDNQSLINKIVSMFRALVRKLGFNLALNEVDVRNILAGARKAIGNDGFDTGYHTVQPTPLFSLQSKTAETTDSIPEDTVVQAIKDGQPVDAVFRGLWNVAEATQLPKLVRYTSAAALHGAVNFYDNHMPWAHSTMQHMAKGLIDQYGLSDEYKHLKASMAASKASIVDEVRDIIKVMEDMGVSDEDATHIHEILTNEEPRSEAWDAVTEPIRKRVEELGQKAVDLGLISQASYDRNKGMYLHRVYMKYEMNRSGLEKWADDLAGGRRAKIKGKETMERGLSYFVPLERILSDTGLMKSELMVDGEGATIYKNSQMSANGQKAIKVTYSLKPVDEAGTKSEEFRIRASHAGRVKIWRDFTKAERKEMGQITDARYVLGKTFSMLAHDLSTGEFFQQIAENEAWTLPKDQESSVDAISGEAALRHFGVVTGAEWVRVPETGIKKSQAKVYGALSGRVIRAEIFQDLNQLNKMQQNGIWKTIMTSFKLNKTARNPVVHFNNIMSNLVLMDMADVRFSDLYRAIHEMRAKGKQYQEAKSNGAFGVSYAEHELKNEVLDKLIDEIHTATGARPVGLEDAVAAMDSLPLHKQFAFMMKLLDGLWHGVDIRGKKVGLKNLDQKMLNYYQHEDEIFRMATYMRRRGQGMGAVEAGLSARDQFLNYDISAPWINAARATVLPFISYSYRAIPIVAKSIAQRPWKMAKYFTIAYAMNAIGYALTGGDEDKERKSMRDEVSGMTWIGAPRLIRMAWNNEENNPYYWDVRRLIPVGDVFDMNQYHAALPIIPASVMPSGPIAMGFEFLLNKTGFFGEEIVDPLADDWVIGTQKTLDWLWKSYGPSAPWVPYSYYWDKMGIAMTGGRDRLGREYKVLPALASSFGIKIAPHDVSYGMALKGMEIERTVQAVRHRLSFLEKDYWQHKINKAQYVAKKKRYVMKLEQLEARARELFN